MLRTSDPGQRLSGTQPHALSGGGDHPFVQTHLTDVRDGSGTQTDRPLQDLLAQRVLALLLDNGPAQSGAVAPAFGDRSRCRLPAPPRT